MCCKLQPNQSTYWYDLALSYYYQSKEKTERVEELRKSIKCVLHAINLKSDQFIYWNLLGVLYTTQGK